MLIPQDYHLHTLFSGDNPLVMAEVCRQASAHGIPEIGFTEHYDQNPLDPWSKKLDLPAWAAELERCRAEFAGQLIIRAGVEIGEPPFYPGTAAFVQSYPFDYTLGSLHWVGARTVFDADYFARPAAEAYREYFVELERLTRRGGFDVLAHLNVVARVGHEIYQQYDPRPYADLIRAALKNCLDHGIVPEINTGGLRRSLGQAMPGLETLRWYVELGGEAVTLGSDAHRPAQVNAHLPEALELARAAGVKYLAFFEKRVARFEPLSRD